MFDAKPCERWFGSTAKAHQPFAGALAKPRLLRSPYEGISVAARLLSYLGKYPHPIRLPSCSRCPTRPGQAKMKVTLRSISRALEKRCLSMAVATPRLRKSGSTFTESMIRRLPKLISLPKVVLRACPGSLKRSRRILPCLHGEDKPSVQGRYATMTNLLNNLNAIAIVLGEISLIFSQNRPRVMDSRRIKIPMTVPRDLLLLGCDATTCIVRIQPVLIPK